VEQQEAASKKNKFTILIASTSLAPSLGSLAKQNVFEIAECLIAMVKEKEDNRERRKTCIQK
jgi:hypothetical protein